jgi:hypothetical protein
MGGDALGLPATFTLLNQCCLTLAGSLLAQWQAGGSVGEGAQLQGLSQDSAGPNLTPPPPRDQLLQSIRPGSRS